SQSEPGPASNTNLDFDVDSTLAPSHDVRGSAISPVARLRLRAVARLQRGVFFRGGRMKRTLVRSCALAVTLLMVLAAQRDGQAQNDFTPARAGVLAHAVKLPSHGGIGVQHLLKKRRGADLGDARLSPMGKLAYLASTGQLQELIDDAQSAPGRSLQVIDQRP